LQESSMFGLFDSPQRRIRDERELRDLHFKYGADAAAILKDRASDSSLSSRDRRHWRRLARKARRQKSKWLDELNSS
jgi:hypothetical protein